MPMLSQVTRHEITWYFNEPYLVEYYINGDPNVRENTLGGGVGIVNIDPAPEVVDGRSRNGSMINPGAGAWAVQGYDSNGQGYSAAANRFHAGPGEFPITIAANSSLVSSKYNPNPPHPQRGTISDTSVLSVLAADAAVPVGAFRPPYVGDSKPHTWSLSDIIWGRLPGLAAPSSAPSLAGQIDGISRLWLINSATGYGRSIHPSNHMPEYGGNVARNLGDRLLSSLLDYTQEQKEPLVIHLLQLAIDIAACIDAGMEYIANGGHNAGMKCVLGYAGHLFDSAYFLGMFNRANRYVFQDDQQTFAVAQVDVDTAKLAPREGYTSAQIGMAEWGEKHAAQRNRDDSRWGAAAYRDIAGGAIAPHVLTAMIMGLRAAWNHEPAFRYMEERYMLPDNPLHTGSNPTRLFVRDMWSAYSGAEPGAPPPPPPPISSAKRYSRGRTKNLAGAVTL